MIRASGVGEAPVDRVGASVARLFPVGHLVGQGGGVGDAAIQALPAQDTQFDLGHVQPTAMFGGVMNLQPVDQRPSHCWLERLIQCRRFVGIQVVHHQDHFLGVGIAHLQQVAYLPGKIDRRPLRGDGDVSVPGQRFARQEQVRRPAPLVLVIDPRGLTRFGRDREALQV